MNSASIHRAPLIHSSLSTLQRSPRTSRRHISITAFALPCRTWHVICTMVRYLSRSKFVSWCDQQRLQRIHKRRSTLLGVYTGMPRNAKMCRATSPCFHLTSTSSLYLEGQHKGCALPRRSMFADPDLDQLSWHLWINTLERAF